MAILRQNNWLGQQRVDVPHFRLLESAVAGDFDLLAGTIIGNKLPYVVQGLSIPISGIGLGADTLTLSVADTIIIHYGATESGSMFSIPNTAAVESLSPINTKVIGSFSANQTNYVGMDILREADDATAAAVKFLDADTRLETEKTVPLGRTLTYRIIISTEPWTASPHLVPIAKVVTDASNLVTSITDARPMMFRLGSGGDVPAVTSSFSWVDRTDNAITAVSAGGENPFTSGDKQIGSFKEWMDASMTRLWEIGGGERWFSPTTYRDVKLAYGQPVLTDNNRNFYFYDSGGSVYKVKYKSLKLIFANSTATYNKIEDSGTTYGTNGVALADGYCLYVDVDRTTNATVVAKVAPLATLGAPTIPGSRHVIAWRADAGGSAYIFTLDAPYESGRIYQTAFRVWMAGSVLGPTLLTGVTNAEGDVVLDLSNNTYNSWVELPIPPVGAVVTKYFLWGSFAGAISTQKLRVQVHNNRDGGGSFVPVEATFLPTANPQIIGSSTIANVTGTSTANADGYIECVPSANTTFTNPKSSDATFIYKHSIKIKTDVAGAGASFTLKGVGIEYTYAI